MSQRPRLSTEACDKAEDAFDFWLACWADRRISDEEADGMTLHLAETATTVSEVDAAVAETVAGLRCGLNSDRVQRLRAERRMRIERAADAA